MFKRQSCKRTASGGNRPVRWILLGTVLFAIGAGGEEKPLLKVDLLLLESRQPSVLSVGLYIKLAPDWHLYWINPGDAGLAPEITWNLPQGYNAGPLRFPAPEKIVSGGIVAYGFKTEVLIVCRIRPVDKRISTVPSSIACRLDWMACRESCVTGQEAVKISPKAQAPADRKRSQEILSRFVARFPKPSDAARISGRSARLVQSGNRLQLELLLSGRDADRVSDFYPYPLENFVIAHSRISASGGKVTIPLEPSGPSARLDGIAGLLIIDGEAYEFSIPVSPYEHSL